MYPEGMKMAVDTLASELGRLAQTDGEHPTAIEALSVFRRSAPTEPMACFYTLGLAIAAQGDKQVALGDQVIHYGAGQSLLTTVDLPVVAHITQASPSRPYLGLLLTLDAHALLQLATEMELPSMPREPAPRAISVSPLDAAMLDAVLRLIRLLDQPQLVAHIAPLVQQEIMVRLLSGAHGPYLRHLLAVGSPSHQIAKAMSWLKQHFRSDILMDELAASVHMSPSTFRQHFRALTGMSPVQYQKQLRLQEARQLMLHHGIDAGSTATRVGYESASQFSRDYSRLFGAPPQRDIKRMRELAHG